VPAEVDEKALTGLKFSEALPRTLAVATLATRLADLGHARAVLVEPTRFRAVAEVSQPIAGAPPGLRHRRGRPARIGPAQDCRGS
jgi:hypothetical protein